MIVYISYKFWGFCPVLLPLMQLNCVQQASISTRVNSSMFTRGQYICVLPVLARGQHYHAISSLALSANLPEGLYILLVLITFFFFLSFFNDRSKNNYLRIYCTDFSNLFTKSSILGADDRSRPLFIVQHYASTIYAVIVCLSVSVYVCHTPALYQNG